MTTEEQLAERAKADEWIASWNKQQTVAYDEAVKEREKRVRAKGDGAALPRAVEERLAKLDFNEHIRYRLPVGALLDTIEVDRDGDRRNQPASTASGRHERRGTALRRHLPHRRQRGVPGGGSRHVGSAGRRRAGEMHGSIERRGPVTGEVN
jgi:hypothetical protein